MADTVDEGVFFVQIEGNGFILLLRGDASGVAVPFDSGTKSFKNRAHRNHGTPIDTVGETSICRGLRSILTSAAKAVNGVKVQSAARNRAIHFFDFFMCNTSFCDKTNLYSLIISQKMTI